MSISALCHTLQMFGEIIPEEQVEFFAQKMRWFCQTVLGNSPARGLGWR